MAYMRHESMIKPPFEHRSQPTEAGWAVLLPRNNGESGMALDWLVGKYEEVSKGLKTEVTKIKNKQFLESVLAGVVAVSYADGEVSSDEKTKMMGFLRSNDVLSVFDSNKVIELFNKYMSKYEF